MELSSCRRIILFTIFVTTAVVDCSNIGATRQDITLDNDGGFIEILIAIHEDVEEDHGILSSIEVDTKFLIRIKSFAFLWNSSLSILYFTLPLEMLNILSAYSISTSSSEIRDA